MSLLFPFRNHFNFLHSLDHFLKLLNVNSPHWASLVIRTVSLSTPAIFPSLSFGLFSLHMRKGHIAISEGFVVYPTKLPKILQFKWKFRLLQIFPKIFPVEKAKWAKLRILSSFPMPSVGFFGTCTRFPTSAHFPEKKKNDLSAVFVVFFGEVLIVCP